MFDSALFLNLSVLSSVIMINRVNHTGNKIISLSIFPITAILFAISLGHEILPKILSILN
jgi:hypothetical protein